MSNLVVCSSGSAARSMTFNDYYAAYPDSQNPGAWEAVTIAIATNGFVVFETGTHEVIIAPFRKDLIGAPAWQLRRHCISQQSGRALLLGPRAEEPIKLLAGPVMEPDLPSFRLELTTKVTMDSFVRLHAPDAAAAIAMFENNPARWAPDARDIADNTFDWNDHDPRLWTVTSIACEQDE